MARQEYLQFLPVASDSTADLLKTQAVWQCLRKVRERGCEGITAEEISEETGEKLSTVYNALRLLYQQRFVRKGRRRERKVGRPEKGSRKGYRGKPPQYYFEPCEEKTIYEEIPAGEPENPWGDLIFSMAFLREIAPKIRNQLEETKLGGTTLEEGLVEFTEEFYEDYKDELANVMPSDVICDRCGRSHDGYEFLRAVVLYVASYVVSSERMKKTLEKLDFAK